MPWTRRVVGLFAVAWLGMALQPCAMAMGSDADHDCPHCPPAAEADMPAHGGHHGSDESAPCAGGSSGCESFGEYNYDGRHFELKLKDLPNDIPIAVLPPDTGVAVPSAIPVNGFVNRSCPPGVPPPLSVLYCVYLK